MKLAFLSCDDLSSYVVDDDYLFTALKSEWPELNYQVVSWSDSKVDWSKYDVAVLRTTWDYTQKRDQFLSTLENIQKSGCRVLNPIEVVRWNSHKSYMKDLVKSGVNIIESYFLDEESLASLDQKLVESRDYVLKPIVGASAEAIKILPKAKLLQEILNLEKPSEWFVQPFMKEVLDGERSIFYFNSKFSHACRKVPKDGDFRVQEEHGGLITAYRPDASELEFAENVLNAIGKNLLYSRIDFLKTATGPQLIELELIEPSLYFRTDDNAARNFVNALKKL